MSTRIDWFLLNPSFPLFTTRTIRTLLSLGISILSCMERRDGGVNGFGSVFEEILNVVDMLDLHDFPLQGSLFTYFESGHSAAHRRIDSFLVLDGAGP